MASKITQFFYNLVNYGGISSEKGVIYVWGDPNIFFSIKGFAFMHHFLYEKFGENANNLLYWLGKVNGRTATEVLIKRYGFKIKDLNKFVNGATQDGFGLYKIKNAKYNPVDAHLDGTNCCYAETYKEMYGKQKTTVDSYMAGVIAGGSEPLFKTHMTIKEENCVAKGNKKCTFHEWAVNKEENFPLIKKSKVDVKTLLKNSTNRYFKVAGKFKIVAKRNIRIGDGAVMCNGIQGVLIAQRIVIILFEILGKILSKAELKKLIEGIAEKNIDSVYNPKIKFSTYSKILNKILESISTFGFGEFKIASMTGNKIKIQNNSTKYPADYNTIVKGTKKEPNELAAIMIKKLFEKYQDKKVSAIAMGCNNSIISNCFYEVTLG